MFHFAQGKTGRLNEAEKKIVKYLLGEEWRNQDILALINLERPATVNPGRVAEVKKDSTQVAAKATEYESYFRFKRSFDLKTGLNPFLDERLIKSREAMKMAVSIFNNPTLEFRSETFSMLSNVAWTYLALEFSDRNGHPITRKNGKALSLADFLKQTYCPFSEGVKNNLKAIIKIRDASEHTLLGPYDGSWMGLFQACCMNYERSIVEFFGDRLSLGREINFALQFSGLSVGQAEEMAKSDLPEVIKSVNSEIYKGMSAKDKDNLEFEFSVVYTTVASSKSKAKFNFVSPASSEGVEIANVLVKHKPSQETHPYTPSDVVDMVKKRSGKKFSTTDHTKMWQAHAVRPDGKSLNPGKTDLDYCYYHPVFKRYTYNDAWVDRICRELE
ncbi:DUF3644 domain-containing protein [Leisingera aquaemixtae]|uniref:DUF3644 domain-containing protein n=1 Tax=Leisingera aquaemixtae TaxID=1396826 RepID=UPI0021A31452|nr:DUF3644 domain-containing protein [Leisingera aquaemixtae]UWQ38575.1 DUF3644 domain-containing protein [Leisingera aquaemixtae]